VIVVGDKADRLDRYVLMISAFASGWNVTFRKVPVGLRRDAEVENEIWIMERNPNYRNKALLCVMALKFTILCHFPDVRSAILSGLCPRARSRHRPQSGCDSGPIHSEILGERDERDLAAGQRATAE